MSPKLGMPLVTDWGTVERLSFDGPALKVGEFSRLDAQIQEALEDAALAEFVVRQEQAELEAEIVDRAVRNAWRQVAIGRMS